LPVASCQLSVVSEEKRLKAIKQTEKKLEELKNLKIEIKEY